MIGERIDLVSGIGLGEPEARSKDILGRVYEYFLGKFANAEEFKDLKVDNILANPPFNVSDWGGTAKPRTSIHLVKA